MTKTTTKLALMMNTHKWRLLSGKRWKELWDKWFFNKLTKIYSSTLFCVLNFSSLPILSLSLQHLLIDIPKSKSL